MNARIVAGFLKGRVIRIPEKQLSFRPTLERARVSIADMLQPRIGGSVCADVCAGSGAIGFELLSRGAVQVDFVEKDPVCAGIIRSHARIFGVEDRCRIVERDAASHVADCDRTYDIVFYDPPYDDASAQDLLEPLLRLVRGSGIFLYQRHRRSCTPDSSDKRTVLPFDTRRYGNSIVETYRPGIS